MRIVFFADLHPLRLGDSYCRAMVELGHDVTCVDIRSERKHLSRWLRSRLGHRLTRNSRWARAICAQRYNNRLMEVVGALRPTLLFILSGDFVLPDTVRRIKRLGVRVALYHPDNPLPPHYASRPETLPVAAECDLYLVWGELLAQELRRRGVSNARFLPFAWDREAFPYQGHGIRKEFDVAFVGGWDPARERLLDEIAGHCDLRIWGPRYWLTRTRRQSPLRRCIQGGELVPMDAARTVARARITLNVVRDQHVVNGQPDGVIMRNFEVPGAGGFLLTTRTSTAGVLFREGETAVYFNDVAECLEKISHYLARDRERESISVRAHQLVAEQHLYTHRFQELLALLP
jgi:spore maturation protein CgeB